MLRIWRAQAAHNRGDLTLGQMDAKQRGLQFDTVRSFP